MRAVPALVASVMALTTTALLLAQAPVSPTAGTGLIVGRVVDGNRGAPVTRVAVTIGGPTAPARGNTVLVDSQGRFLFGNLAAGTYTLTAQKPGYLITAYGRMRPGGPARSLSLRDGERVTDAEVKIWRESSISGTVLDEAGEPVSGAMVWALSLSPVAGGQVMGGIRAGSTDDRGVYRIPGLTPGRYVAAIASRYTTFPVSYLEADNADRAAGRGRGSGPTAPGGSIGTFPAAPSTRVGDLLLARSGAIPAPTPIGDEQLRAFPITFHPAANSPDQARQIFIEPGGQAAGVDFTLKLVPVVKVSGIVTSPNGPVASAQVRVSFASDLPFQSPLLIQPATTVTDAAGRFTLLGVTAGRYSIDATATIDGASWSASERVTTADRDLPDLTLALAPMARVYGRFVLDGNSPSPAPRIMSVGLDSVDGAGLRQNAPPAPDGTFDLRTARPGRYFLRIDSGIAGAASQMGSWTLQSAIANGHDVSDEAFDLSGGDALEVVVTLTDHPSMLAGTVRDARGNADASANVLVFPVDDKQWTHFGRLPRRVRSARPSSAGAYSIPALPAGDYFVVAVPDDEIDDWPMAAFLRRIAPLAGRVTIASGANATMDLVTRPIR